MHLLNNAVRTASAAIEQARPLSYGLAEIAVAAAGHAVERDAGAASDRFQVLRGQLATVDVEIKQLLAEIEKAKTEDQDAKSAAQDQQDHDQQIMQNLDKAADSYQQLLDATKL
jgi:hypothetical protein